MAAWHDEHAVLQAVPSRIVAVCADGTVSFVNRAALALLERAAYEVLGKPLASVCDSSDLQAMLASDLADGEHRFDITWVAPSKMRRELGVTMTRVQAPTSIDVRDVLVFRDIGEWRQHEIELRRLKGMNALGQMAAGFAHEVRNPLAAMQSLAEALGGELAVDDPRMEYPMRMLSLTQRIDNLVKDALRFGRPKAPSFKMYNPQQLITDALDTLAPRLSHGPRPSIIVAPDLPSIRVDDSQVIEILVNFLENAIDAAGAADHVQTHVAIHADEAGRFVRFDVVDDGPGMSADVLARVFDPFFTTKSKGTGLGLAIARRLAGENGGKVCAVSVPNVATTFSLLLPLTDETPALV